MPDSPLRVLMISKACLVGAYQRKLEEIAAYPDINLTVVVPPRWRDQRGDLELERAHIEGYRLVVEPIRFNGRFHLHYYPRIGQRMTETRPDIVHIDEEPYNFATYQTLRTARRAGAQALFFSWQNILRQYPFPFAQMEGYVLRHVQHAIVGTQEAAEVWRGKGYTGPMTVIPQFGVDPHIFAPGGPETRSRETFTIGYAGRLVPEKGVDLILHAAAALPGAWRLSLAGDGPERDTLTRLAGQLGIADRVTFEGHIPSTEMVAYYHRLDALVLPSRTRPNWKEQFGRLLIEAMACGVPVIGAQSGAIPGVIGKAGLTFPEGNARALREHLSALMQDEAQRRRLAEAGRTRVLERFTQAQVAAQTVAVYREMAR